MYEFAKTKKNIISKIKDINRPIIIEFSGMPKSGKTAHIKSIKRTFERNGLSVKVYYENASYNPVLDKLSPEFNIWSLFDTINNIVKVINKNEYEIVLIERGIFDCLIWFNWFKNIKKMQETTFKLFEDIIFYDSWFLNIDLVLVYIVQPHIALEREPQIDIDQFREGRIMNLEVLSELYKITKLTVNQYYGRFNNIKNFDTSKSTEIDSIKDVLSCILNTFYIDV